MGVSALGPSPSIRNPLPATDPASPSYVPTPSTSGSAHGNQSASGSHATQTRSGCGGNRKDAILASTAAQHQAAPVCRKSRTPARHSSPSSEEESSDSSDSDTGSEDHWALVRRWAARDGNWELVDKIPPYAAPVIYKGGGGILIENPSPTSS